MHFLELEPKIKSDPETYLNEFRDQLFALESLISISPPPVKQITPMISFVVHLCFVDSEQSIKILNKALSNINDIHFRQSVLKGQVSLARKGFIRPEALFKNILMYGHDLPSYIKSLGCILNIDCFKVLHEWYYKGNEKQKSFCYYFLLNIFNKIHESKETAEDTKLIKNKKFKRNSSTEEEITDNFISENNDLQCSSDDISDAKLLEVTHAEKSKFSNKDNIVDEEELEKIICEALFQNTKLSRACMLYFLNRTDIKFDISRIKNGREYAKRLYKELNENLFEREPKIMKIKLFILFKKNFKVRKSITNIILKMIDLDKPDLKDLLHCLVDSTSKNESKVVFKILSEEMINENKEDDVICYGLNILREIYYKIAGLEKPKMININEEMDEDYVLEEISSDFSVISDGDKMKEIKEEVLKYVSCFKGKKSKQINFAYKSVMKAIIKNEAIDKPVDYLSKTKTKEEKLAKIRKSAEEILEEKINKKVKGKRNKAAIKANLRNKANHEFRNKMFRRNANRK